MKKVLITGITGFAGSYLAQHLHQTQPDAAITGTYISEKSIHNIDAVKEKLHLVKVELTDYQEVVSLIARVKPDEVYHLAALPSPAESFRSPALFLQNNINAELHILEALRQHDLLHTRVVIVASSEVYGLVKPEDLPINEQTQLRPVSPYGVSKITQDYLGLQYHLAYHMPILRARPFGHAGPKLSEQFVISAFAKKIAEIEKGKREPILHVGNLESKRDLTDVRDIVRAYSLLMSKGIPGDVYNIGCGTAYKIADLLQKLLAYSTAKVTVVQDQALLRPNDIPELRCNNTKFVQLTGWHPEIAIEKTLKDTLEYWRGII